MVPSQDDTAVEGRGGYISVVVPLAVKHVVESHKRLQKVYLRVSSGQKYVVTVQKDGKYILCQAS